MLGLEPASIHCINLVGQLYPDSNKKLDIGFLPACGLYTIRAGVLRELVSKGLGTSSPFMYFFWEDKEFSLKLWLMGYKTASYRGLTFTHLGSTSKSRPIHRRYTRYLEPIIATFINMPLHLATHVVSVRLLYILLISDKK